MIDRGGTLAQRLWKRTDIRGQDDCWLWQGCQFHTGYGYLAIGRGTGRNIRAHRASWVIHHGAIPADPLRSPSLRYAALRKPPPSLPRDAR